MKKLLKIHFSRHSEQRLERSELTKSEAIKEIKRHLYAMKRERGTNVYRIIGELSEYVLTENFLVITVLPRMTRQERKKNFKTKVFGREYMNLDKDEINSMIFKTLKTNY